MATKRTSMGIAQVLLALRAHDAQGLSDGQLLRQFLGQHDEAAFAALVRRHGPMVLGVCRRVLRNAADAEDAFQATFLVFVRKAATLKSRGVLGDWLHGVARRTALKAKGAAVHRWAKEQAMARPEAQGEESRDDWLPLLDEELSGLPEKYRLPIVLCDLEGRTRKEAAGQLGWPEGTVAGRLARARTMLSRRLVRRGVILPGGVITAALPANAVSACVPSTLVFSTIKAATLIAAGQTAADGLISANVAGLTGAVMKAMLLSKLKTVAIALAVCVLGGFGWVAYSSVGQEPRGTVQRADKNKSAGKLRDAQEAEDVLESDEPDRLTKNERDGASSRELIGYLRETIEMQNFLNKMTLRDFLGLTYDIFKKKNKEMPVLVDTEAFREEAPNVDVYGSEIQFQPFPRKLTLAMALKVALSQASERNAEMLICDGVVLITTKKRASLAHLLQGKVSACFENCPLADVVRDFTEKTGVSITLDPRAEDNAKTRISATFGNDVTLGAALRIVADIAGLKVVDMQSGLYVTTPANARELERDLRKQPEEDPRRESHTKAATK